MKKIIYLIFTAIIFLSCENRESMVGDLSPVSEIGFYKDGGAEDFEPPPSPPPPPQQQTETIDGPKKEDIPKQKKIIKDGDMRLEVEDLPKAKTFIDTTLQKFDAYYENETYESNRYQSTYQLKIRVPAENFEKLVQVTSEEAGKVTLKNINARDVTEEFYDITTRLENNESYLLQYRNLLKRANSIKDILDVQEKIRVLEEEMDSKKGRLKFINDRVSFSTLNLTLIEKHEWKRNDDKNFFERAWSALKDGGGIFMDFVMLLLRLWPFVILIGVIVYLLRRWRRKKK